MFWRNCHGVLRLNRSALIDQPGVRVASYYNILLSNANFDKINKIESNRHLREAASLLRVREGGHPMYVRAIKAAYKMLALFPAFSNSTVVAKTRKLGSLSTMR